MKLTTNFIEVESHLVMSEILFLNVNINFTKLHMSFSKSYNFLYENFAL